MTEACNERNLSEKAFPFVIVDGLVLRVREDNRVRQQSALISLGDNEDGYREILGLKMDQNETESSWKNFFRWLKRRGLHGVDVIVSDEHSEPENAALQVFQDNTLRQGCQFHFRRIFEINVRTNTKMRCIGESKRPLESATKKKTLERVHEILNDYENKAPKATETLEIGFEDAIAVLALPGKTDGDSGRQPPCNG